MLYLVSFFYQYSDVIYFCCISFTLLSWQEDSEEIILQ
uniref:Uncharacterized protein n=1 Tax=Arundo donax TaxID=35708 RepID=A0A0A8YK46_ARUDO